MKISVVSGKGGTGKTFVAVNLAVTAQDAVYMDCDVEEPNGRLFLKPNVTRELPVHILVPHIDSVRCTGCRKCVSFCRFNALAMVKGKPILFPEICHSCGGCSLVCPVGAISERPLQVGAVQLGYVGSGKETRPSLRIVTGVLSIGKVSAVPVVKATLDAGAALSYDDAQADVASQMVSVIDCPPGSGCSVLESVAGSDFCLMVVEPTAFGFHNFRMIEQIPKQLGIPCAVVINKDGEPYAPLEAYCAEHSVPILARIPYREDLTVILSEGTLAVKADRELARLFEQLLRAIVDGGEA